MDTLFSVVILTKNSMSVVQDLVGALFSQKFPFPYEIIFMDNNSTDGTVEYLQSIKSKKKNVRIIHVPENEFSHSGTRMQAARLVKSKFIVFFTDDVIPIGADFLNELTKPVREGEASAACGIFQIGGKRAYDPVDAYLHNHHHKKYKNLSEPLSHYCWNLLLPPKRRILSNFDNCASCLNRKVLLEIQFPNIPYGEDMVFAKRLILNGHKVALVKSAKFYHWHKVKFSYMLKRMCIDQYLSIKEFDLYYVTSLRGLVKNIVLRIIHRAFVGLFKVKIPFWKKFYWIGYNMKILTADFLGKYIGSLDENSLRGMLAPLKKNLLKKQKQIIKEIEAKSILRY
jgi:glycosyltransferase involved in cell wall biosynthesis